MEKQKNYNQFSKEYNALYLQNILSFQKKVKENGRARDYYVDFYPSFGVAENEYADFLIYGQAVNGWISGFEPEKVVTDAHVDKSIASSNEYFEPLGHNPLDWVNVQWDKYSMEEYKLKHEGIKNYYSGKYRANRSFFWNVTYKLINDFYGFNRNEPNWSSKMVWSNLHKIAPEDANPNDYETNVQMDYSIKLFEQEIKEVNPKFCIILTNGKWWEPFGKALLEKFPTHNHLPSKIDYCEQIRSTKIIVTKRPRFAGHDLQDMFVNQILSLINQSDFKNV
ncbi:MAG: hypothetical protein JST43_10840 [Bacteroidetes bacterium]|nr:hypothetical protein [Bacteroidota bacterium]MBS1540121.1 hypothetical protein [Bacteroidota bacterium]